LALAAPKASPPAAVKDAILQEITTLRRATEPAPAVTEAAGTSSGFAWIPWALAAGFAVFAGTAWIAKSKTDQAFAELSLQSSSLVNQNTALASRLAEFDAERTRLEARISTLEAEKNKLNLRVASLEAQGPIADMRAVAFAPQAEAPQASEVAALWDTRRQTGVLDLSLLPAPAADKDYQLWIISPDSPAPISAGVVSTDTPQTNFRAPRQLTQVAALAISLEPKGGSETPRGPIIYVGKF
jgi:cell division protein FtsB